MQQPDTDIKEDRDAGGFHESNYYGIATGIAGLLFGFGIIALTFTLADGFS